ncbi:MAG: MiaB/RimO family radical SAM methylthiotransferase [Patescibacteria group bacterium]|nr:MiaB/RimO family radical SAM methylthiotransferase [Patescibacteria group bacterium]
MKISFYALGCKANQADSDKIRDAAAANGWTIVPYGESCDYSVISGCAVTSGAEQRTRQMLRAAKKSGKQVIAAGCFVKKISEIDLYFSNPDRVIEYLKSRHSARPQSVPRPSTRAFIRIQDGCNFNCSYCLIRKIRGKSVSRSSAEIIAEINQAGAAGAKEIILTGINICQYRENKLRLANLVGLVLSQTTIPRIRFGSVDPRPITAEFIALFREPRLMPHLHLSLQSGSNRILKLMNRAYSAEDYTRIVRAARRVNPLFSFSTDIIVGFPGETMNDVNLTIELIRRIKFINIHLFPYSERPDTAATRLKNNISPAEIKSRMNILSRASENTRNEWLKNYSGRTLEVLYENNSKKSSKNIWYGYSPYYFRMRTRSSKNLHNLILSTPATLDTMP